MYIELEEIGNKTSNEIRKVEKIAAHDALNSEQIHSLRETQKGEKFSFDFFFLSVFVLIDSCH